MIRQVEKKENLIRNLSNDVIDRCESENIPVEEDLCIYSIDLKLLSLSRDPSTDQDLLENIIISCINDFKEDSVPIKTLKLQLDWQKKYQTRDEIKRIHHERIFKNVVPLLSEITEKSLMDAEHLYKKIVLFIMMFAGLGNPSQQSIIKETHVALHSVFKTSEVENFLNLSKETKEQQLMEFARLITGIMLFNKDCKKGGEAMDDLPLILTQGVRVTKERLLSFKDQLMQKINPIVKSFLHGYNTENENLDKSLLNYYRQIEFYLNNLITDLQKSFVIVESLVKRLQSALLQVHKVVRYRVAVATVQVFPLFIHLSNLWVEMQEEVDILSEINNNFVALSFAEKLVVYKPPDLPSSEITDALEEEEILDSSDFYPGVKLYSFLSLSGQESFQFGGFCAWTLVHKKGVLIAGNAKIGVLQYSDRFYSFSSAKAANEWAKDPNGFINSVFEIAAAQPELIKFLNLYSDLEAKFLETLAVIEEQKATKSNAVVQTELHPIESHIDRDYSFSEWELKRKALKLATLTGYLTKSQQTTEKSCFRMEKSIQVTSSKNNSTQTVRDGFSSLPNFPMSVLRLINDWKSMEAFKK